MTDHGLFSYDRRIDTGGNRMTDHGLFSYDPATRILSGLLLPFGELSRTSVSQTEPAMFSAASISLPRDPSVVTLNRHHNRFDPVGRAVVLEKRDAGVYAEFQIADTDEGDAYLRDQKGTLRRLSAEVTDLVRRGTNVVRARLTGAALVTEGAFASAALFAVESSGHSEDTFTDSDGTTWTRVSDTTATVEDNGASTSTTTITETVTKDNAEADTTAEETNTEEEALMGNIVPDGAATTAPRPTLDGLFAALTRNDADALAPYRQAGEMFALQNLQHSGPTTVTIGADTGVPDYLGELWNRAPYNRRIVPLLQTAALTAWEMKGWRWVEGKTPTVDDYAGNVTEVPTNALDTEPVTVTASRLAGGHRLDRRFTDFNDQAVIASYLTQQTEDYKRKTDAKALAAVVAAATTTTAGAVPAGISKGLAAIVDGALDVIATENVPAYALVSPELWRDILLTPKDDILAYLETGFGFEQGTAPGFTLRPAAVGTGKVIVGAREALTFYELGETPIRVDGVVPGNGATDVAVFGYWATLTNNAKAIRSVTVAAG